MQLNHIALHQTEDEFLRLNHAQAGMLLTEKWELDSTLIHAIETHHDCQPDNILIDCIFAANQISKKLQFGNAGNPIVSAFIH